MFSISIIRSWCSASDTLLPLMVARECLMIYRSTVDAIWFVMVWGRRIHIQKKAYSLPRVWHTNLTHAFYPQVWSTRVTHEFDQREWFTNFIHENDPRVWLTRMAPEDASTNFTHENHPRDPCEPRDLAHFYFYFSPKNLFVRLYYLAFCIFYIYDSFL